MYEMVSENKFGICVLEEWKEFKHDHIMSNGKEMFDFQAPVLTWLPRLNEVVHMFIVSRFLSPQSIANAFDIIKLCRNNLVFVTIITPTNNKDRNDLKELKLKTDIFLYVEDEYYENETITDPVSYAIFTVVMSFDEYIDKDNIRFQGENSYYAFSQCLNKALSRKEKREAKTVVLDIKGGSARIDIKDIYYIETQGHITTCHVVNGEYQLLSTMRGVEEILSKMYFFRISKWYLINLQHVDNFCDDCVTLGKYKFTVSRTKRKDFLKALTAYWEEVVR